VDEDWKTVAEDAIERLQHDPNFQATDLFKTEAEVFDLPTMKTLSHLIRDGFLSSLDFPVSTGKEGNVFRGTTPEDDHVAVKIYRVDTSSFRSHLEYLLGDPRFDPAGMSDREVIEMWAEKEYRNLHRLGDAGCRVPEPVTVENHVLLMEYVGEGQRIAPLLQEVDIPDPGVARDELDTWVRDAWEEADLVHGDLSPYNVLVRDDELVVIDVAQAVTSDHPRARELLERDLETMAEHFQRQGLDVDAQDTFTDLVPPEEAI
jgi:RIO kinase 1